MKERERKMKDLSCISVSAKQWTLIDRLALAHAQGPAPHRWTVASCVLQEPAFHQWFVSLLRPAGGRTLRAHLRLSLQHRASVWYCDVFPVPLALGVSRFPAAREDVVHPCLWQGWTIFSYVFGLDVRRRRGFRIYLSWRILRVPFCLYTGASLLARVYPGISPDL